VVRERGRGSHVEAVVAVELEFLFRGEVAAHAEIGGVLDQGPLEGDAQAAVDQFAGLQGHEGVPAEQPGPYGRPLRHSRGVVEVDLVDRADLGAVAVEGLAADQVARIDVGLHGASVGSQLIRKHYKRAHPERRPLEGVCVDPLVGWPTAADPVRESPPEPRRRRRSNSSPESLRPLYRTDEVTLERRAGVDGFRSHRR